MKILIPLLIFISTFLTGCINSTDLDNTSIRDIKTAIVLHQTTSVDIRNHFNLAPGIMARDKHNNLVEVFAFIDFAYPPTNFIPVNPFNTIGVTEKYLTVLYDKKGTVSRYYMSGICYVRHTTIYVLSKVKFLRPLSRVELNREENLSVQETINGYYEFRAKQQKIDIAKVDVEKLNEETYTLPDMHVRAITEAQKFVGKLTNIKVL